MQDKSDFHKTAFSIAEMVYEKNKRYGNSALEPCNIFSKLPAENSICIRLDDKLNRVKNSQELRKNDIADIMGYLLLLCKSKGWQDFSDLID